MPDNDKTIYKTCREAAGYTQERAAELLNLSVRQLARFEAGELIPGDDIAYISQVAELEDQVEAAQGQAAEAQALVQEANAAAEEARIQMESAQAQADDAKAQAEAAKAQAEEAQANVQAAESAAAEKDATIAAQAQEIEALKADSGDAVVKSLEQAYEEGVESNG